LSIHFCCNSINTMTSVTLGQNLYVGIESNSLSARLSVTQRLVLHSYVEIRSGYRQSCVNLYAGVSAKLLVAPRIIPNLHG
jgi:hypothetical protein